MIKNNILNIELLQGYQDSLGGIIIAKMIALYEEQSKCYLNDIELALPIQHIDTPKVLTGDALIQNELLTTTSDDKSAESYCAWKTSCHKMKGASASVGLLEVYEISKKMEKMDGSRDEKIALFIQLKQKNKEGIEAFLAWCEQ